MADLRYGSARAVSLKDASIGAVLVEAITVNAVTFCCFLSHGYVSNSLEGNTVTFFLQLYNVLVVF